MEGEEARNAFFTKDSGRNILVYFFKGANLCTAIVEERQFKVIP